MTEPSKAQKMLDDLAPGSAVKVKLDDGSEVSGKFCGVEDGQVQLEDREPVATDRVQTVAMEIGSQGVE